MHITANRVRTALRRRKTLSAKFDVKRAFAELEESCVPSYVHANPAASAVAWLRLMTAAELQKKYAPSGPVLDFGAATGELFHMLGGGAESYSFIEEDNLTAAALLEHAPSARRETLQSAPAGAFQSVFALDSLEHNENPDALIEALLPLLAAGGVFILSGPTENALYRLGRRLAGFSGHYHHTTVADIESALAGRATLLTRRTVPFGVPLFHVSAWRRKN